jgi:hypothetical protein
MIGKIRKGSLYELYIKLFDNSDISNPERLALLAVAFECLRHGDEISQELGYRIVTAYAVKFGDYEPLLNAAAREGFAPLVDALIEKLSPAQKNKIGNFSVEFLDASLDLYEDEGIVLTNDQWELRDFFNENDEKDLSISAPTSFGKSELIIEYCRKRAGKKICIIVPTKALIAQTRRRILEAIQLYSLVDGWKPKIVMHPDANWASRPDAICIYTQERLFRHFISYPDDVFSEILVDEAHNIFGKEARELLLSQVLTLHQSRADSAGKTVRVKYFTPFLVEPRNVALKYRSGEILGRRVKRNLKSERFLVCNLKGDKEIKIYDQFFDRLHKISEVEVPSVEEYVADQAADKNIVYQNRPVKMERMVKKLFNVVPLVEQNDQLEAAVLAIRDYIHTDYLLAEALERGIAYHHGSVPDIVKLYVEDLFTRLSSIKFILCSSTLLEGVNIPATRLFLPTVSIGRGVMNASQFKNLVGRVCRYKEIFGAEFNEELLMPEIHLVVNAEYMHSTINPKNFLRDRVRIDKKEKDINENPLIELGHEKLLEEDVVEAETFLDVIDPTARGAEEVLTAHTSVGYKAFIHNIREVDVLRFEHEIDKHVRKLTTFHSIEAFLSAVADVFIARTEDIPKYYDIRRFLDMTTRDFYTMLLRWKVEHMPFGLMVKNFIDHWQEVGDPIFVGRWGDVQLEGEHFERWVNISEKTHSEQVNLAIVRIQDEYDFIETFLLKYIEFFRDVELLPDKLYYELKYGTDDTLEIELIRAGFNNNLAKRLLEDYGEYVSLVDDGGRHLVFDERLISEMENRSENPISIFETKLMAGM